MTSIKIFNVCTHAQADTTNAIGRPTPAVVAFNPIENDRFATGGGDNNIIVCITV